MGQGCQVNPGRAQGRGRSTFHSWRVREENNKAGREEHTPHPRGNSWATLGTEDPAVPDLGFFDN